MDTNDRNDDEGAAFAALGAALTPLAPPAGVAERLRARLMASVRAQDGEDGISTRLAGAEGWQVFGSRVQVKLLRRDAQTTTALFRLEPQATLPPHVHDADEECFVIEGDVLLGGQLLHAGDFQLAAPGSAHTDGYSSGGCLMLVRTQTSALAAMGI